jgi:hypothetical protein
VPRQEFLHPVTLGVALFPLQVAVQSPLLHVIFAFVQAPLPSPQVRLQGPLLQPSSSEPHD